MGVVSRVFIILSIVVIFSFAKEMKFKIETVVADLSIPWGMTFINDNKLLINQKNGKIVLFDLFTKKLTQIKNPPKIFYYSQGGLLDVQTSPDFKKDGWIYFTYSKPFRDNGVTTLARAKLKGDTLTSWEELLETVSYTNTGAHYGSRITFDDEGYLYFSIGDRGVRANGQDIYTHAGTIVRLHLDGSVPKDNPFVGVDGLDEIYTYGHRNPQGVFYDKKSKKLFSIEHGPRGGDEINLIEKGKNYGWAIISHRKEYWSHKPVGESTHKEGMEQPIKIYTPSIAPSSLIVYSGKVFKKWKGNLFSGALAHRHLNRVVLSSSNKVIKEERLLKELDERIRNVIESPDGLIYIATDSGKILRLKPSF